MTETRGPGPSIGSGTEPARNIVLIADAKLFAKRPSARRNWGQPRRVTTQELARETVPAGSAVSSTS